MLGSSPTGTTVVVAEMDDALGCDPEGCGFKSRRPPLGE